MGLDNRNDNNYEILQNTLYVSFESRKKEAFLKEIITKINEITGSLKQISVKLDKETQGLIKKININLSEIRQLIDDKAFNDEKDILRELKSYSEELTPRLKQLPYSDQALMNNLCQAINKLLEKLANFFMNGPMVSEGVYIPVKSKSYHFNFFHPAKPITPSVDDLSEKLSAVSANS